MAQTFLFPNTDLPGSYYHESWKISWFFRNFHDCTECFFHSLCTHGNRRTTLWLYIRTFPGSRYRRLCYAFYVFIFWICCSAGRRIDLPRRCFKNSGTFRQMVCSAGILTCLCTDAWKLCADSVCSGCRPYSWIHCHHTDCPPEYRLLQKAGTSPDHSCTTLHIWHSAD